MIGGEIKFAESFQTRGGTFSGGAFTFEDCSGGTGTEDEPLSTCQDQASTENFSLRIDRHGGGWANQEEDNSIRERTHGY